ncbi:hypothetical protein HK405_008208, partial [Cladochytrium tenue]
SCETCRTRKMKCDGHRPCCANCVRAGRSCHFVGFKVKVDLRPEARLWYDTVKQFAATRVGSTPTSTRTTSARETARSHPPLPPPPPPLSPPLTLLPGSSPWLDPVPGNACPLGPTAVTSIAQPPPPWSPRVASAPQLKTDVFVNDLLRELGTPIARGAGAAPAEAPATRTAEAVLRPRPRAPPDEESQLVARFFEMRYVLVPVVARAWCLACWSDLDPFLRAAVLAAAAVAGCHDGDNADEGQAAVAADWYFASARKMLPDAFEAPSLQRLQALCILAASATNFPDSASVAWLYVGLASAMIRLLQVDVDPAEVPGAGFDWLTAETRRRCWWSIFILDRWTATLGGRPTCLPSPERSIGPICSHAVWSGETLHPPTQPCGHGGPTETVVPHLFPSFVRLTDIGVDLVDLAAHSRLGDSGEIGRREAALEARLAAWERDLPPTKRVVLDSAWIRDALTARDPAPRMLVCLQLLFRAYVSMLHKRRVLLHLRTAAGTVGPSAASTTSRRQAGRSSAAARRSNSCTTLPAPNADATAPAADDDARPLRASLAAARAVADLLRALLAAAPPRAFAALPYVLPLVNQAFLPLLAAVRCGAAPQATDAAASLAAFVAYYRRVGVTHSQAGLPRRAAKVLLELAGADSGGGGGSAVEEPVVGHTVSPVMNAGLFSTRDGYTSLLRTGPGPGFRALRAL